MSGFLDRSAINVFLYQETAPGITTDPPEAGIIANPLKVEIVGGGSDGYVIQPDPTKLKATVIGSGNFTVVQPTASNLNATVSGTISALQSGSWAQSITGGGNTALVTSSNALKIDGSAVTQPISGSVSISGTPTISGSVSITGTPNVNIANTPNVVISSGSINATISGSISNTSFGATQSGVWTVQPGNTANTTAWKVDGSAVTQPISGSVSISGTPSVSISNTPNVVVSSGSLGITNTSFSSVQSGTWTVQPGNTANTTPWLVNSISNRDTNRTNICWYVDNLSLSSASEGMLTVSESRDAGSVSTFTSKIITSGKRLRITSITAYAQSGSITLSSRVTFKIKVNTAGSVTTSAPTQVLMKLPSTPTVLSAAVSYNLVLPDGPQWLGDGTSSIGISCICPDYSALNVAVIGLNIHAFEY